MRCTDNRMSVCWSAVLILWLSLETLCDLQPHSSSTQNSLASSLDVPHVRSSNGSAFVSQLNDTPIIQKTHSPPTFPSALPSSLESLLWRNGLKSVYSNGSPSPSPSPLTRLPPRHEQNHNNSRRRPKSDRTPTSVNKMGFAHLAAGEPSSLQEVEMDDSTTNEEDLMLKLDRNYTPMEIADYIFSTGDEKGISQAIADMVQDGQLMASRDDVIHFLNAVQRELSQLRSQTKRFHYSSGITKDLLDLDDSENS